tara:strand:+ start:1325 stop:1660 length:336 start_codon:yes stop_codon:yes gene_type:complete
MLDLKTPVALILTLGSAVAVTVLFSFLFEIAATNAIKGDFLEKTFGIKVELDTELTQSEYLPGINIMLMLWFFFALMRIVQHNVDFLVSMGLSVLPKEARDILTTGGFTHK